MNQRLHTNACAGVRFAALMIAVLFACTAPITAADGGSATAPSSPAADFHLTNDADYRAVFDEVWSRRPTGLVDDERRQQWLSSLAIAAVRLRWYTLAEAAGRELTACWPHDGQAWGNLSCSLGRLGRFEEAADAAHRALYLPSHNDVQVKWILATWLWRSDKKDEAASLIQQIQQIQQPHDQAAEEQLWHGCRAFFHAMTDGDESPFQEAMAAIAALPRHDFWMDFFKRDIPFDQYRLKPWFIALAGATGAGTPPTGFAAPAAGIAEEEPFIHPLTRDQVAPRTRAVLADLFTRIDQRQWERVPELLKAGRATGRELPEFLVIESYGNRSMFAADDTTARTVSSYGNQRSFTGYFLDQESGLDYARARMYSPTLGRFVGRDPIVQIENNIGVGIDGVFSDPVYIGAVAFPRPMSNTQSFLYDPIGLFDEDRVHTYRYAEDNPAGAVDPSGMVPSLSFVPEYDPKPGKCGGYNWRGNWILSQPSVRGGWIIQDLQVVRTAEKCGNRTTDPIECNVSMHYWETWPVGLNAPHVGGQVPENNLKEADKKSHAQISFGSDDNYISPGCTVCTKGTTTINGSATFYEGYPLPGSFVANNGNTFAHAAPATKRDPSLFSANVNPANWPHSNAVTHNLTTSWDCCNGQSNDTLINSHTP